jgi:hypothetical protein
MEPFVLVIIVIVTIFALWRIYGMYQISKDSKEGWFNVDERPSNIPKEWIVVKDKYGNSLFYKGKKNEIYSLEGKDLSNHNESPGEGYLWIDGFGWWFFPGSQTLPRDTPVLLNIETTKEKRWYFADKARNKKYDNMFYEIGDKNRKPGPSATWSESENIWISNLPTPIKPEPETKMVVVKSTTTEPPVPSVAAAPSVPTPVVPIAAAVPTVPTAAVPTAAAPSAPLPAEVIIANAQVPSITQASLIAPIAPSTPAEKPVAEKPVDPLEEIKSSAQIIQSTTKQEAKQEAAVPTLTITTTSSATPSDPKNKLSSLKDRLAASRANANKNRQMKK